MMDVGQGTLDVSECVGFNVPPGET